MSTVSSNPPGSSKLAAPLLFSYGLLGLPLAVLAITYFVYLPKFYSDVVGIPLGTLGTLLLACRVWDAFTDPLIGSLSDRTRVRFGRRRSWIAASTLPLGIAFFLLLTPHWRPDSVSAEVWFTGISILFFLFWTMVSVPYEALGTELSSDFHERTRLLGFRDGAVVLGTLLSGVIPALLYGKEITAIDGYIPLGICYVVLLVLAASLCVSRVREPRWDSSQLAQHAFFKGAGEVLANKPFRILLIAYTIAAFGAGLPPVLLPFYIDYVLLAEDPSIYLVLYFLVGFLFLPLWIRLARLIGKKEAWISAMLVNTGAFAGVFFLGEGDLKTYGILVAISGIGYGASLALPSSMQADVIDSDELTHGIRREGQFIGFWSIAKKMAAALGGAVALTALDFSGYVPNQPQNESTLFSLRFLYAGVPCLCNFLAIAIALRYPISEKVHKEIRTKLDARKAQ